MSLNGDEVVALIAGGVIIFLLLTVLLVWLALRDPNRHLNASTIDDESRVGLSSSPPVISLTLLEPSALPKSQLDVLGRAAETGPDAPNWPLAQNTVNRLRTPLRPRPNRRTMSSELSPFGYIRRSDMSALASGGNGPGSRPASISAAWLSPSHAAMARGSMFGGSYRGSYGATAVAGPGTAPPGSSHI